VPAGEAVNTGVVGVEVAVRVVDADVKVIEGPGIHPPARKALGIHPPDYVSSAFFTQVLSLRFASQ